MTATTFMMVPLARVKESPLNPRKIFREGPLQELAASIRAKGVLTPMLVRPAAGGEYELAAGHRRRRASELAGLTEVPVLIREMSDDEFLEVLTVENLQREDVEPLDEAEGFRALIDMWRAKREAIGAKGGYKDDVLRVAERIGKSISHVYSRLKLLDLNPRGRQYLQNGVITAGHAVILASLQPTDQNKALEYLVCDDDVDGEEPECVESVRDFSDWVKYTLQCRLSGAPFQLLDSKLGAGACTTCPKRAGYVDGVKAKDDLCMDRSCYAAKCQAHVERLLSVDPALLRVSSAFSRVDNELLGRSNVLEGADAKLPCAKEAIYVDGPQIGTTAKVCSLGAECPAHGRRNSGSSAASRVPDPREKAAAEETRRRTALLQAILDRLPEQPSQAIVEAIVMALWAQLTGYRKEQVAAFQAWHEQDDTAVEAVVKGSPANLWKLLMSIALASDTQVTWYLHPAPPPARLQAIADLLGVQPPAPTPKAKAKKSQAQVQSSARAAASRP